MRIASLLVLSALAAWSQSAETIPFRAILSPQNEVPAVNISASGMATVWLHVVRDAQGHVVSASTDFDVSYRFPTEVTFTGMHIHRGRAGENGPVTIDSGIRAADAVRANDAQRLRYQGYTAPDNTAGLDTVNGLLTDPSGFYVNLHTTDNPSGVIRGQLMPAEVVVLMAQLSTRNEVPAIENLNAGGTGSIIALMTRGPNGQPNSGLVTFDATYQGFPENTTFTGFHIHEGLRGVNGPVTINTGIAAGANAVTSATGSGNLHYDVEVPMANEASVRTLAGLFQRPDAYYMNLHTSVNPGGAIRSQLRSTDFVQFQMTLSPANEVPAIASTATAPSVVLAFTTRNGQGQVDAAVVVFDVNYRMPGAATITGLHVHNGAAGANGPVTIDSGISARVPVETTTGNGNVFRIVTSASPAVLQAMNSAVATPEAHYLNIHTSVNPSGLMRAQLMPEQRNPPLVGAVISAVSDPGYRRFAPGGLATIFGSNLMRVVSSPGDSSDGRVMPTSFNGTTVRIGDFDAPIASVGDGYMVVQVPYEVATGTRRLTVRNPYGTSEGTDIQVNAAAPAIFFDGEGGIVTDLSFRLAGRAANPARKGQYIIVYSTGLAVEAPAGSTGRIPDSGNPTRPVTATIDGRAAEVLASVTSPGFLGLYQTYVLVPGETRSGTVPLILRSGEAESNRVNIVVQ
jgi:uncharacterized protein (TIGR03437 family)